MAARLESAARSPVLRSALKALAVASALYFVRANSGFLALALFTFLFWAVYLRPAMNNRKFLASAIFLFASSILLPPAGEFLEWLLIALWAAAFFLLLGVKNLVLLRRQGSYEAVHYLLVFGIGGLYLLGLLSFVPQIVLFISLFLLFREFYFTLGPSYPQRLTLTAAALALLLVEIAWMLSFLPIGFLTGAAIITLTTFIFHDLILHHLQGDLTRRLILRNITLFVFLAITLFLLP